MSDQKQNYYRFFIPSEITVDGQLYKLSYKPHPLNADSVCTYQLINNESIQITAEQAIQSSESADVDFIDEWLEFTKKVSLTYSQLNRQTDLYIKETVGKFYSWVHQLAHNTQWSVEIKRSKMKHMKEAFLELQSLFKLWCKLQINSRRFVFGENPESSFSDIGSLLDYEDAHSIIYMVAVQCDKDYNIQIGYKPYALFHHEAREITDHIDGFGYWD